MKLLVKTNQSKQVFEGKALSWDTVDNVLVITSGTVKIGTFRDWSYVRVKKTFPTWEQFKKDFREGKM